jgi:hypothetical protein
MYSKLSIFFVLSISQTFAQTKYSKITFDRNLRDTFSFVNRWDYPENIIKDESTGQLSRDDDKPIQSADTVHLYFTANCKTNVQGGFYVRYCFATKNEETIILKFSDEQGDFASEFYSYIKGDSFYFRPKTVYPMITHGEKISYRVTRQKLILNKNSYVNYDTIIGYIDCEFTETYSAPIRKFESHRLYLRGYIKTPINARTTSGR